jgi:hypothetical protein
MTFKTAAQNTRIETRTENGMKTYDTSLNACVDLFFDIGASRGKNITAKFERAFAENPEVASKILCWARDVRGGAGERQLFRDMLLNIEENHKEYLEPIMQLTPTIGRWDDLLVFKTDAARRTAFDMIAVALRSGDGLCAKWMPRKSTKKDSTAHDLRMHMSLTPKQYRKTLVSLTQVVETPMCAKEWDGINFSHVPSLASARYQTAFHRNAPEVYQEYKDALDRNDGSAKVNAGAVYPYDVLKPLSMYGETPNKSVIKAQWEALPLYIGDELVLPMVDVSGSMGCGITENTNLSPMDIAVSLGLYLADKNTGAFSDMFLTFSESSKIEVLGGDIISKYRQLQRAQWGMNTSLTSAFDEVLRVGKDNDVADEDMPKFLLILSDMEFDRAAKDRSAIEMIEKKYKKSGYTMPKIVWWNLNARSEANVPVRYDANGTALVSGFSPAIMTSILGAKTFTPEGIMLDTIDVPRYDIF